MLDALHGVIIGQTELKRLGLSTDIVRQAIEYTHSVLDHIDHTLVEYSGVQLSSLVELVNLSAIVGNLFRAGISRASAGAFVANKPHTYPDLVANVEGASDIEIKVALEQNKPKGHLVKPGPHITVRYVLADQVGQYEKNKENRGSVVWIWEVRVGQLDECHFNISSTAGDSGKTAVINASGLWSLAPVFLDLSKCPYPDTGRIFRSLDIIYKGNLAQEGHSRGLP